MAQSRILPFSSGPHSFVAALCVSAQAQTETAQDASAAPLKVRPIPVAVPQLPFPAGSGTPGLAAPIEYRSAGDITRKDSDLVADAQSSINEHVGRVGLIFKQGAWSYQQIVCPALPNHLFLRFLRNNGTGDVSVFTASIPRNGEGRVRIIPIQLRGYSLFSPAPINALTLSAFNHVRAGENPDKTPDWLGTGLCYAALAGAHPQAAILAEDTETQKFPTAVPAVLQIPAEGGAFVSFTDAAATPGDSKAHGVDHDLRQEGQVAEGHAFAGGAAGGDRCSADGDRDEGRAVAADDYEHRLSGQRGQVAEQ